METVKFGIGVQYDNGLQPSVDVNNENIVVEVHKSENKDTLWYHVGKVSVYETVWGPSCQYDNGVNPSVSVNDNGVVVEVHESQNEDTLWYHVGRIDGSSIKWGSSHKYDKGTAPSVSINNNGIVVEVHKSQNEDTLWYHTGKIDGDSINWSSSRKYDKGVDPDVSINNNGIVVEVHKSQNEDTLWYHTGAINNDSISFGASTKYDSGVKPSVAINDNNIVVEVHKSENKDILWSHTGQLKNNCINFNSSVEFDTGLYPSVACSKELAVQNHQSENHDTLWSSEGLIIDYANWMGTTPGLESKKLWEITLPGTHDSGTYSLTDNVAPSDEVDDWIKTILNISKYVSIPGAIIHEFIEGLLHDWSRAQEESILDQLNGGIRYLDLRFCYKDGLFSTYHGLIGVTISDVLHQVKTFMQSVKGELVILNLSHFCNFEIDQHKKFINIIEQEIGGYLFKAPKGSQLPDLLKTTIGEYTTSGPRVLLIYRDDSLCAGPEDGFWPSLSIYDKYSDSPDFNTMRDDQLDKLQKNSGNENKMFLLSWTLTANPDVIKTDALNRLTPFKDHSSLHNMTKTANRQLGDFVKEHKDQYKMNVLYVDFYAESKAVDLAISMNC